MRGASPPRVPRLPATLASVVAAVEGPQRLGPRGHVAKAAQPDEAVSGVEVAELTEEPDARRSLRLDEFILEQGNQVLTPARLESVLPQLDDGTRVHRCGIVEGLDRDQ